MPAPRKPVEQQRFAYEIFREDPDNPSPATIHRALVKQFEDPASLRTVASWVKGFKERSEWTAFLDSPFEWHRLPDCELPWKASPYLLEMRKRVIRGEIPKIAHGGKINVLRLYPAGSAPALDDAPLIGRPTVRQARWWWRIHRAVPDASMEKVWEIAQRFVNRELASDVLGEPLYLEDLEGLLAYRYAVDPEDEGARQEFAADVAAGYTPALRSAPGYSTILAARKVGGRVAERDAWVPFANDMILSRKREEKEIEDKQEAAPPD